MTFASTRRRLSRASCSIALLALIAAGCGGTADNASAPSSTLMATVSSDVPAQISSLPTVEKGAPTAETQATDEVETSQPGTPGQGDGESVDTTEPAVPTDEFVLLEQVFQESTESGDLPPLPTEGPDAYLGGSLDEYSAAAIRRGLEEAGVDLAGIKLSVLPVSGSDASLLVMEVGEEYLASALPSETEGGDITGALLALPEIERASITELVTVYRGADEDGPFAMTFVVSIDALRDAYASGSEIGDALLVQVDRGS